MRNTIIIILGLCAFLQSARGISLVIDSDSPDNFAFDVVWGPTFIRDPNDCPIWYYGANAYGEMGDANSFAYVWLATDKTTFFPSGLWIGDLEFEFVNGAEDRHLANVSYYEGVGGIAPVSFNVIDDGFGVHAVYDLSNIEQIVAGWVNYQPEPEPTPDGGLAAAMLATSFCALASLWRRRMVVGSAPEGTG